MKDNNMTRVRGFFLVRGLFSLLCATAVFFTACEFNFDSRPGSSGAGFVAVENIYGIPTGSMPFVTISLSGTVMPENATYKKTDWSIKSDGGTNSTIEGSRLTANAEGTVTVRAVIKDGLAEGVDYTQDFPIVISLTGIYVVREIFGVPTTLIVGNHVLEGRVAPTNAVNTTIIWSVVDAGTTGAHIYGNEITVAAKGTVKIRGTVQNGLLEKGDFTQDFSIFVPKTGVYLTGGGYLWEDGGRISLPRPAGNEANTSGIVYANGNQYIAGGYAPNSASTQSRPCYWVNGELKPALTTNSTINSGYAQTLSIAVDAATSQVYILGSYRIGGASTYQHCYWKVDENGEVGARVDLTPPAGATVERVYLAVYNGKVYIPFRNSTNYNNYYWDETGAVNQITVNGSSNWFTVNCVTAVDGAVYFAGYTATGQPDYGMPFYFVKNGSDYTAFSLNNDGLTGGYADSIIVQNGALVLYGRGYTINGGVYVYSWNTAENSRTALPPSAFYYETGMAVFSDGDVFIPMSWMSHVATSYYGYTALVEGKGYFFPINTEDDSESDGMLRINSLTGIAVKPSQSGPITIPVTGVTLNKSATALLNGATETLVATVTPSGATNQTLNWASNNPGIVSVDSNGTVTAGAAGTATITVTTVDGNHQATCTVTVTVPAGNQTPVASDYTVSGTGTFTYNGSARTVTVTPQASKSAGARTVLYNGSSTAPVNAGTYTVTFNVAGAAGWNAATGLSAGTLTINRATYTESITWPVGLTAIDGESLEQVSLTSWNTANGTFTWTTPSTFLEAGSHAHNMTFTPTNTNYHPVTNNVNIMVGVDNTAHTWSWATTTPAAATTNGVETGTCSAGHAAHTMTRTLYATGTAGLAIELINDTNNPNNNTYRVRRGTATGAIYIPAYWRPTSSTNYDDYKPVTIISNGNDTQTSNAFGGVNNSTETTITGVTFAPNSPMNTIAPYAFQRCVNLASVTLPAGLTTIGRNAFSDATSASFTSITIPASVTTIDVSAFYNTRLTSVTFAPNSSLLTIAQSAFGDCTNLANVTLPAGLTTIGVSAFRSTRLTNVTIPASVREIQGNYSSGGFFSCTYLTTVTFAAGSQLTVLAQNTFNGCTALNNITLPAGLTRIEDNAFQGCTGLTGITIPSGVTYLGGFEGCTNLASINIPASVTEIGVMAFMSTKITSVTLPAGVTAIGSGAFTSCASLTSVNIPTGVTAIKDWTFTGCTSLSSITIPAGVTVIEYAAFQNCTSLSSVTIPASVTSLEQDAFGSCSGLTSITISGTISTANFHEYAFNNIGDIRAKYLAAGGGAGTYIRTGSGGTATWTKQ